MGWGSGSALAYQIAKLTIPLLPKGIVRVEWSKKMLEAFEGEDCDTLDELRGEFPELDKALDALGYGVEE